MTRDVVHRVVASDGTPIAVYAANAHDDGSAGFDAPAVIVCHGFVQNRLSFECADRSLLTHLNEAGIATYVVELRGRNARDREQRRSSPTSHGLHEYADVDARAVVDFVRARHRHVGWLGHSMGGLVGTLLPARTLDRIEAVATIGAPLFAGPASLRKLVAPRNAVSFARALHKRGFFFEGKRWSRALYAGRRVLDVALLPIPLRIWAPGSLDQASLAYTLQQSFADDSWAVFADLIELAATNGERAGSVDVDRRLYHFDRPLFAVAGDADDLAPPLGARPLFERASSRDKTYVEVGGDGAGVHAGHIDMLIGAMAPRHVWKPITAFFARTLR